MKRGAPLPGELLGLFADFWDAYPYRRPNPRALAEAAFAAAVKAGAKPADLVAAAVAYAAECKAKGVAEAFVVHARTFLAQRRFEDYLAPATGQGVVSNKLVEPDHPWWPAFRGRHSAVEFRTWIVPLTLCGTAPAPFDIAILEAPSAFHRDIVRDRYAKPLKVALRVKQLMLRHVGEPAR